MAGSKVTCQAPKGKKGYTISFRHPVQKDKAGKYGLKIHRGLGTSNSEEAEALVKQLDTMIEDEYWHNPIKKEEAYSHFSPIVVDAFYDPMECGAIDYLKVLDKIYLPGKAEGYSRGLFVGPSGAGKTSLLRLLAGTEEEKFPTTSTGRTTTCNLELIFSDEDEYEAVISFISRHQLEMFVQENIEAAVEYCIAKKSDLNEMELCDKLLVHQDLALRLTYILGDITIQNDTEEYNEYDDVYDEEDNEIIGNHREDDEIVNKIQTYLTAIKGIASELLNQNISLNDEEYQMEENDEVLLLRDSIVEEIMKRFQLLVGGEKLDSKGKWVNAWYYKTSNRDEFISTIKRFSSNSKNAWGTLLTPLVNTMRIKGQFKPSFMSDIPKVVLIDGQGLGHKTTVSSIPSETYKYFPMSDSIIIVDNAEQPMMENVKIALRGIIEYGKANQLMFAFTHIDGMKGDNLRKFDDKRRHIKAALNAYLFDLKRQNNDICSEIEIEHIQSECYYFSGLDKREQVKMSKDYAESLLKKMREHYRDTISVNDIMIKYDAMTLYSHMQIAIREYRENWSKKLGYPSKDITTEHWSRIKALSRRLAYFGIDHYNYELMPLADFRQYLTSGLNIFINRPLAVQPEDVNEDMKVEQMNQIKVEINQKIAEFITSYMWMESSQFKRWDDAYKFAGKYSAYYRSEKINEILEFAAPQIDNFAYNMTDIQRDYIKILFGIVDDVFKKYGCKLERFNY